MKRLITVSLIGALALLSACGGDKPPVNPPVTPPVTPPPNTALVTPVGANIGDPVTQTIGAAGGVVTLGKVTVSAPSGAFNGSSLRLQAISDTYNDTGQGIAISSDATWNKYLTVTFPIDPSDDSPESLGLAVQQSDGSWRSLEPVKVDVAAGTVSAGLPAVTEVGTARLRAQGLLDLTRVIKFKQYYFKPPSATVKVGKTQTFVPYAQVLERPKGCPKPQPVDPNEELAPLAPACWHGVTREYPFTNSKDDFARIWNVNGVLLGNSTVGTITRSSGSGATYTAPDKKPSPDTVTVSFQSINTDTLDSVSITPPAKVKIIDDVPQTYTGPLEFSGSYSSGTTFSGKADLTWKLKGTSSKTLNIYEFTGSVQVTFNHYDCSPVSASVPAYGSMNVYQPGLSGELAPFSSSYYFYFQTYDSVVNAQCGNPRKPTQLYIAILLSPFCVGAKSDVSKYTDIAKLTDSGTWKCSSGEEHTANWDFAGK